MKKESQIVQLSEGAITIDFGNTIDIEINRQVINLYNRILNTPDKFWIDLIPAYSSLTVIYDPLLKKRADLIAVIKSILIQKTTTEKVNPRLLKIPVCYNSTFALDAGSICNKKKISNEELINLHTKKVYHVFIIGFLPGFAYMGSVDDRIATPRLEKPRTVVPEGSVGIAGEQTGIYPFDSPGGWNIIGRTPVKLFDVNKSEPTLFQPGDEVEFYPITLGEFESFDLKKFNPVYES